MKTVQEYIEKIPFAADSVPLREPEVEFMQQPGFLSGSVSSYDIYSAAAPDSYSVAGSAAEVFGSESRLESISVAVERGEQLPGVGLLNELLSDGLTILFFFIFLIHLFRHRPSIDVLFRSLFVPGQFDSLVEDQSVSFRTFIRSSYLISFLSLLVIAFKWCAIWINSSLSVFLPEEWIPFLLPILIGVLFVVTIYKRMLTGIIAVLSGKHGEIEKIRYFNRFYMAIASHFLAPVALLTALADPEKNHWLFVVQVIVLIILVLYYLLKSFSFFVSRKISILQWILYLCAVEILPVSFFVLFALRGFEW